MFFSWLFGASDIQRELIRIQRQLDEVKKEIIAMVRVNFDDLRQQIEHSTTVQKSAVELIRGLADQIAELAKNPTAAEIQELANQVRAHANELAGAIALHEKEDEKDEEDDEEEKP